jgi:hypothetical protein
MFYIGPNVVARYGGEDGARAYISRLVTHSQTVYAWPSLIFQYILDVRDVRFIDQNFTTDYYGM